MSNRGMMKWAPYKSLVEQDEFLQQMNYKKHKKQRPIISNDEKEKINNCLVNYKGESLVIAYYEDGYIYEIKSKIKRIDVDNQLLILPKQKIKFTDIVHIENTEELY